MAEGGKRRRGVSRRRKSSKGGGKRAPVKKAPPKKGDGKAAAARPAPGDMIVPYDDGVRHVARLLFITGTMSIPLVARRMDIPEGTVRNWSKREKWGRLRREVRRLAAKDSVRQARMAMGRFAKNIDDTLTSIVDNMETRLKNRAGEDKLESITDEATVYRVLLEAMRLKVALLRTFTTGYSARSLSPHPRTVRFGGTEEEASVVASSHLESLLANVPGYLREAAKFVLAADVDDLPAEVLDALVEVLDGNVIDVDPDRAEGSGRVPAPAGGEDDADRDVEILD